MSGQHGRPCQARRRRTGQLKTHLPRLLQSYYVARKMAFQEPKGKEMWRFGSFVGARQQRRKKRSAAWPARRLQSRTRTQMGNSSTTLEVLVEVSRSPNSCRSDLSSQLSRRQLVASRRKKLKSVVARKRSFEQNRDCFRSPHPDDSQEERLRLEAEREKAPQKNEGERGRSWPQFALVSE